MIWKHKTFLPAEGFILASMLVFSVGSIDSANLKEGPDEKPQPKDELPLDAFQTRTLPLAKKYLLEGELDKSKNLLETLLELDPKNAEAHLILAEICIKQKSFERASILLKGAMELSTSPDLALKANAWLKVLPTRLTKPKAPVTSKGALNNVQTVEDDREVAALKDKSLKILFFTASWLPERRLFADEIKETAQKSGLGAEVKTVEFGESGSAELFKEYSISLLPAIVVLKSDGHFAGGLAGAQASRDLKSLLRTTR